MLAITAHTPHAAGRALTVVGLDARRAVGAVVVGGQRGARHRRDLQGEPAGGERQARLGRRLLRRRRRRRRRRGRGARQVERRGGGQVGGQGGRRRRLAPRLAAASLGSLGRRLVAGLRPGPRRRLLRRRCERLSPAHLANRADRVSVIGGV